MLFLSEVSCRMGRHYQPISLQGTEFVGRSVEKVRSTQRRLHCTALQLDPSLFTFQESLIRLAKVEHRAFSPDLEISIDSTVSRKVSLHVKGRVLFNVADSSCSNKCDWSILTQQTDFHVQTLSISSLKVRTGREGDISSGASQKKKVEVA